jgi:hypothetical protein
MLPDEIERIALLGWRCVPATRTKKGMFAGYLDAATHDLDQLGRWADEYPGCCWKVVPTGSGVWFLDVDVPGPEHAADGVAALRSLCDLHGPIPPRPHARSPSGGHLLAFRDAGHAIAPGSGKVAPGLDTLAGRVCPMVPPSRRNGSAYAWVTPPWEVPPPVAPEWLLAAVAPPLRRPLPERPRVPTTDMARRSLGRALDSIAAAPAGQRNATLNRHSFSVARWIAAGLLDEAEAVRALYAAGLSLGLNELEVRGTVRSGCLAGYKSPIDRTVGNA